MKNLRTDYDKFIEDTTHRLDKLFAGIESVYGISKESIESFKQEIEKQTEEVTQKPQKETFNDGNLLKQQFLEKINSHFPECFFYIFNSQTNNGELDQEHISLNGLIFGHIRKDFDIKKTFKSTFSNLEFSDRRSLFIPHVVDIFFPLDPVKVDMTVDEQFRKYQYLNSERIDYFRKQKFVYICHYDVKKIHETLINSLDSEEPHDR